MLLIWLKERRRWKGVDGLCDGGKKFTPSRRAMEQKTKKSSTTTRDGAKSPPKSSIVPRDGGKNQEILHHDARWSKKPKIPPSPTLNIALTVKPTRHQASIHATI
jgi:hypothetical protein